MKFTDPDALPRHCPDVGRLDAPILLVGEAPGTQEQQAGIPFVGKAGFDLDDYLKGAGLNRRQCRVMNVSQERGRGSKIEALGKARIEQWGADFRLRLADPALRPRLIVPMGNYALRATLDKPLHGKAGTLANITDWRGFIMETTLPNGHQCKVIPTLHPAAMFYNPTMRKLALLDWRRIAYDSTFADTRYTPMEHNIAPTERDLARFTRDAEQADCMSIDIETVPGYITCVGFSYDPSHSLVLQIPRIASAKALRWLWDWIRKLCQLKVAKVGQNFLYDRYWLWMMQGIKVRNAKWDLMDMSRALDAAFPGHDLGTQASCEHTLRIPYWKTTTKDPSESRKYDSTTAAALTYNGIDNTVQRFLGSTRQAQLTAKGRMAFYLKCFARVSLPTIEMMTTGMPIDERRRRMQHTRMRADIIALHDKLAAICGKPMHAKVGLSQPRIKKYFYEELKLTPIRKRKGRKSAVVSDITALRKLSLRHPDEAEPAASTIIECQIKTQLAQFYKSERVDPDGIQRCSYKIDTNSGRFSSSKNPMERGSNQQNNPSDAKEIFVAHPGEVLVEGDYSQAESRAVGMLTGDARMMKLARSSPVDFDIHRFNAAIVFSISEADVTPEQRKLSKSLVHGSNYGEHGQTASDALLKKGEVLTPEECQAAIDRYLGRFPAILEWQRRVRTQIMQMRHLSNIWGRELDFTYRRLDDEVYRKGYAFEPSSTVVDTLNQYGLVPIAKLFRTGKLRGHGVIQQGHDALLCSVVPEDVYELLRHMKALMERPLQFPSGELTIPVEFKVGRCWGDMTELKTLPNRKKVEEIVDSYKGRSDGQPKHTETKAAS